MRELRVSARALALLCATGWWACGSDAGNSGVTNQHESSRSDDSGDDDDTQSNSSNTKIDAGRRDAATSSKSDAAARDAAAKDTGAASASNDAGKSASAGGSGVPCDVADVISQHCSECHNEQMLYGAPMKLLTMDDFQAASPSGKSQKIYQEIPDRLAPSNTNLKMPPTSKPPLSADELMTLKTWAQGGAKAGTPSCAITVGSGSDGDDAGVTPIEGGSGGAHNEPIKYDDPDMECYNLVAHADGDKNSKYTVPGGATDLYMEFYFAAPWQGTRYTRSIENITDNASVIHHWLLFNNGSPELDGTAEPGLGTHGADEELLYGWAPGASPLFLDPDVGQKLEGGTGFTVETHYNNPGFDAQDASGAKICVTKKVPTHEAGLSWVGTDAIIGTSATGTCTPQPTEIHLIAAQPHMHLLGKHMTVVVNRANGQQETIHDADFSFENQRYYVLNTVLEPGDTMTTTCDYSGFATFGRGTMEEMCYFFTLHWPAGALTGGVGGLLHGGYSCL